MDISRPQNYFSVPSRNIKIFPGFKIIFYSSESEIFLGFKATFYLVGTLLNFWANIGLGNISRLPGRIWNSGFLKIIFLVIKSSWSEKKCRKNGINPSCKGGRQTIVRTLQTV